MRSLSGINFEKLLVTGKRGFVGKHLCSAAGGVGLVDRNGSVDLRDIEGVRSAIQALQPEAVIHLAAQSSVAESQKDPMTTISVNFLGTYNLLHALSASHFQGTFVYVSSAEVYGNIPESELPTKESCFLRPRSPYAVSKVAAEALCYEWSQRGQFRIVLARPFTHIGPGQDPRFAIPDFARQIVAIRRGQKPPLLTTGNLDVTRDFTDVRDVIEAYLLLLEHGRNGEIYNICSGRERSIRLLVQDLLETAGVYADVQVDSTRVRSSDLQRMVGDYSKISDELGWLPKIPLSQTLNDILAEIGTD